MADFSSKFNNNNNINIFINTIFIINKYKKGRPPLLAKS